MIFFNDKGDEIGSLIFAGNKGEGQHSSLTFDKFRGDQTIAFQHLENSKGDNFAGLSFNGVNTPTRELAAKMDALKLLPTEAADGTPKINYLDEAGKVTYSLPEGNRTSKK